MDLDKICFTGKNSVRQTEDEDTKKQKYRTETHERGKW